MRENPLRRSPRLGGQQTTPERVGVSEPKFTCIVLVWGAKGIEGQVIFLPTQIEDGGLSPNSAEV